MVFFERKPNPTMLTDTKLRNLKPKDKLSRHAVLRPRFIGVGIDEAGDGCGQGES